MEVSHGDRAGNRTPAMNNDLTGLTILSLRLTITYKLATVHICSQKREERKKWILETLHTVAAQQLKAKHMEYMFFYRNM